MLNLSSIRNSRAAIALRLPGGERVDCSWVEAADALRAEIENTARRSRVIDASSAYELAS